MLPALPPLTVNTAVPPPAQLTVWLAVPLATTARVVERMLAWPSTLSAGSTALLAPHGLGVRLGDAVGRRAGVEPPPPQAASRASSAVAAAMGARRRLFGVMFMRCSGFV